MGGSRPPAVYVTGRVPPLRLKVPEKKPAAEKPSEEGPNFQAVWQICCLLGSVGTTWVEKSDLEEIPEGELQEIRKQLSVVPLETLKTRL